MPKAKAKPTLKGAHVRYDSVADAVALLSESTPFAHDSKHNRKMLASEVLENTGTYGDDWFGVSGGYTACKRILDEGWSDGVARMQEKLDRLEAPVANPIRRKSKRGDHGDEIDMQRVYAGQFETAFSRMVRQRSHGPKRVRLVVDIGGNSMVTADQMFWRGAAALRASDILTEAGYSVEIAAIMAGQNVGSGDNYGITQSMYVAVSRFGEQVSMAHLASVVAFAGFFRTVGFAAIIKTCPCDVHDGLGQHDSDPGKYIPTDGNELSVLISSHISTPERANDEVRRILKLTQGEE